jgi:quercetin 2,3-dioxygenase
MSDLFASGPAETATPQSSVPASTLEAFPARTAELGALRVRRILPVRQRRMVGPWCFFDRFGPTSFTAGKPLDVAPHPHIGLQTVSWLLSGEVLHNDSLGSQGLLRPGELNLMTAGAGIAHAEETPAGSFGRLDGVQLWIALPDSDRRAAPSFVHHTDIPMMAFSGAEVAVIMGQIGKVRSPARTFSPLVTADVAIHKVDRLELPLDEAFEHAVVLLEGSVTVEEQPLSKDTLYYMGTNRAGLVLSSDEGARVLMLGGLPFREPIVMWWNFVAGSIGEIEEAREDSEQHRRFGDVAAYRGLRMEAPPFHS